MLASSGAPPEDAEEGEAVAVIFLPSSMEGVARVSSNGQRTRAHAAVFAINTFKK